MRNQVRRVGRQRTQPSSSWPFIVRTAEESDTRKAGERASRESERLSVRRKIKARGRVLGPDLTRLTTRMVARGERMEGRIGSGPRTRGE